MKDIQLINYTDTESIAYLSFPVNNGHVTGQDLLVQKISKRILTEKSSNAFEPSVGSGFYKLLGSADTFTTDMLEAYANIVVRELVSDMKDEQSTLEDDDVVLADDEKLLDIKVSSTTYNEVNGKWIINLDVITVSNQSLKLQVPLTI